MISLGSTLLAVATAPPLGSSAAAAGAHPAATPLPSATLAPQILQQLQASLGHKSALATNAPWLTHAIAGLFFLLAIALVTLLAFQTTKQEGLSGSIGGRVEAAYRPRLGFDQQLARVTSGVAIAFVFVGLILSITGI
ncbi:MAG: preprotein translocase subunit SecG [Vulcanimicrobiaceae bacterium]